MQTTILYLQQELRKSKQTIQSLEKQLNSEEPTVTDSHTGLNGTDGKHTDVGNNGVTESERTLCESNGSDSASRVSVKRAAAGDGNSLPTKRQRSESVEFEMTYSDPEETLTALTNGK